ncbi:MAG: M23 family metallopeptidase [Gammaproteobacteria bacterium]|jgi:murein DD-endopeptidase MepM/ murein hydrolase activator NlpD
MQIILLSKQRGPLWQLRFDNLIVRLLAVCLTLGVMGAVFYGGYTTASRYGVANPSSEVAGWRADLASQRSSLTATRDALQKSVDALALRLGQMNAHVIRLDALGERLTQMAGLDDGEFDFSSVPPLGGPEELLPAPDSLQITHVVNALDSLDQQLSDRAQQLDVLEDFLLNRKLQDEVHPEGRPVTAGYISSRYGNRTDPFTGRAAFHKGIDFAGREGNDIVAVASGVVVWSGPRYGYGEMIEINHGNGYATRYAHNSTNLVAVGDTVKRGQRIGHMGDTGRATGANLHFEVLRNGRAVDPLTFIQ